MTTFAQMGYKPKDKNGKKQFNVDVVSIMKLIGVQMKILDFEILDHVKNFDKPRMLIFAKILDDCEVAHKDKEVKFWSQSLFDQMKYIIERAYDELIEQTPNANYAPKESMTFEEIRKIVEKHTSIEDMDIVSRLVRTNTNAIAFI